MLKILNSSEMHSLRIKLFFLFFMFIGLFLLAYNESHNSNYFQIYNSEDIVDKFVKKAILEKNRELEMQNQIIEIYQFQLNSLSNPK